MVFGGGVSFSAPMSLVGKCFFVEFYGSLFGDPSGGGAPPPLTFFASSKKVSKERPPQSRCPSGSRWGRAAIGKLAALRQVSLLYPIVARPQRQRLHAEA